MRSGIFLYILFFNDNFLYPTVYFNCTLQWANTNVCVRVPVAYEFAVSTSIKTDMR